MNGNGADQVSIGQREIKPRDPNDPLATTTYEGQFYSREEANELIQRAGLARAVEYNRKSWEQSEAGRLCIKFTMHSGRTKNTFRNFRTRSSTILESGWITRSTWLLNNR